MYWDREQTVTHVVVKNESGFVGTFEHKRLLNRLGPPKNTVSLFDLVSLRGRTLQTYTLCISGKTPLTTLSYPFDSLGISFPSFGFDSFSNRKPVLSLIVPGNGRTGNTYVVPSR